LFATSLRLATRSTADTLPHLNRAAADPSDASARIGRPGSSNSEDFSELKPSKIDHLPVTKLITT
jgi:hypothetical protein